MLDHMTSALDVRFFPLDDTHPQTDELTGRRVNFHYASGNVLQQHYRSATTITWRGVEGAFAGVEQTEETLRVFALGEERYLITWYEAGTVATVSQGTVYEGGYPVCVLADFAHLVATAAYTNPREDGGQYFVVDQARMELLPPDPA